MNNYLIYGVLCFFMGFTAEHIQSHEVSATDKTQVTPSEPTYFSDDLVFNDELYTVVLRVDQQKNSDYLMTVEMLLKKNAYFVSPNSRRDFSGRFTIVWKDVNYLKLDEVLTETPLSLEEFDPHPFVKGPVNWVRVNTTYKQSLKVFSEENFEVSGYLQFTIEPRCSLEKLPFRLSYKNGRLSAVVEGC